MILTSVGTHKLVYFTSGPCYVLCAMNAFCQWNVFRKFPSEYASIWRTITESCFHPLGHTEIVVMTPPLPFSQMLADEFLVTDDFIVTGELIVVDDFFRRLNLAQNEQCMHSLAYQHPHLSFGSNLKSKRNVSEYLTKEISYNFVQTGWHSTKNISIN